MIIDIESHQSRTCFIVVHTLLPQSSVLTGAVIGVVTKRLLIKTFVIKIKHYDSNQTF